MGSWDTPWDWKETTTEHGREEVRAPEAPGEVSLVRAFAISDHLQPGEDTAAFVKAWTAEVAVDLHDFAVVVPAAPFTTATGLAGTRLVFTDTEGGVKLRQTVTVLPGPGRRVFLHFALADPADGTAHDAVFLAMASSFRVETMKSMPPPKAANALPIPLPLPH